MPLKQQRRGGLHIDAGRNRNDLIGRQGPQGGKGARLAMGIGHAVAGQDVVHLGSDIDHRAGRLHAERRRRLDQAVLAPGDIDVDVIDADCARWRIRTSRGPGAGTAIFSNESWSVPPKAFSTTA